MFLKYRGLLVAILIAVTFVAADSAFAKGPVSVKGYFRRNGTYVSPHYRSAPDGIFGNNWSTIGNINPYTGMPGTKTRPPVRSRQHSAAPSSQFLSATTSASPAYTPPPAYSKTDLEREVQELLRQQEQDREIAWERGENNRIETEIKAVRAESTARRAAFVVGEHRIMRREQTLLDEEFRRRIDAGKAEEARSVQNDLAAASRLQRQFLEEQQVAEADALKAESANNQQRFEQREASRNRVRSTHGAATTRERRWSRDEAWAKAQDKVRAKYSARDRKASSSEQFVAYRADLNTRFAERAQTRSEQRIRQEQSWMAAKSKQLADSSSERLAAYEQSNAGQLATEIQAIRAAGQQRRLAHQDSIRRRAQIQTVGK
jgi:hypothetical protein